MMYKEVKEQQENTQVKFLFLLILNQPIIMGYIVLNGWKTGLEKVSLTKLQIRLLKKGLVDSKQNVDDLLDGNIIKIKEDDDELAVAFIEEAKKIGVVCYYQH